MVPQNMGLLMMSAVLEMTMAELCPDRSSTISQLVRRWVTVKEATTHTHTHTGIYINSSCDFSLLHKSVPCLPVFFLPSSNTHSIIHFTICGVGCCSDVATAKICIDVFQVTVTGVGDVAYRQRMANDASTALVNMSLVGIMA